MLETKAGSQVVGQQERPLRREEERRIDRIVAAREYLKSLAQLHNQLDNELTESGSTRYPGHPIGLTREQRVEREKVLYDRLLPVSTKCNIPPEQHKMWCRNCSDFVLRATSQALTDSLIDWQPSLEQIWREQLQSRSCCTYSAYYNLARVDPLAAFATLSVHNQLAREDSNMHQVQKEAGALCLGWYNEGIEQVGAAFEALKALKTAINSRFRKKNLPARALLQGFIDESERMVTEACSYYYALAGLQSPGEVKNVNIVPTLLYWPLFPNRKIDYSDLKNYMDKMVFPLMEEIRPELRTDKNLRAREVSIPVSLHLADVMWTVSTLQEVSKSLARALTEGQVVYPETRENLTREVSIFSRLRPLMIDGQVRAEAKVSFIVRPRALQGDFFTIRIDRDKEGKVQIDIGEGTVKQAIDYSAAIQERQPYSYKKSFAPDGSVLRKRGGRSLVVVDEIQHARDLLTPNQLLAFTTASLSNIGYLMTIRSDDEKVTSHHHPLTTRSEFNEDEFAEAIEAIRSGLSNKPE